MNYQYKYEKYKLKYLELTNQHGGKIKILKKKIKMIEFIDKHIYALNNIDDDILDEHSEFQIGSVTKLFTIVSLLLLHQNKQLNIYDTIGKYIDNNNIKNLIIIDIMNHTSGLKNIFDGLAYGSSKIEYDSATEIYNKWNNGNLLDKKSVGTYVYSSMGYIILGVLIEKITGLKYSDYVKNNILVPLKMENTGIDKCNIILYNYKQKKLTKYEYWERSAASSAGQLKSSINDLILFSKFNKLLQKKSLQLMKHLWIYHEDDKNIYIHHTGVISGGQSKLYITYDKKWKPKEIYIKLETIA